LNVTYDSDFCGLADDGVKPIVCKHGAPAGKFVCFDRCWTGRRFYGCAGQVCVVIFFEVNLLHVGNILKVSSLVMYCRMERSVISIFGLMMSGQLHSRKPLASSGICMEKLKKGE
jgi:hypothetical protein